MHKSPSSYAIKENEVSAREVMGSIPVGDSDISLSQARVMLIN